jgi:NADH-quinone oxidoreductase subunit M
MQFGLLGVFTTNTILGFYIFWELTLLPIFLILYWFGSFDKPRALLQFFLYTLLGSLAMLLAVIGLMHATNQQTYEALLVADINALGNTSIWLMGGFLLAFAVKIPLFPFHTWQAETYTKAPVAGTMLLSAIMLKMALFGLLKWVLPIFDGVATDFWRWPIITLGLIGVVYGAIVAIRQSDIKTLFAYASLSHLGLIAAALMLHDDNTNQIAVVQIVNHSIVSIGLFLAAGIIEQRLGTRQMSELSGIAKVAPRFAFWFGVLTFISLSVPFTAGFIGEFFLIKALFNAHAVTGFIASSTLVLGAVYTLRAYQVPMFGPSKFASFQDLHWSEWLVFAILSVAAIYLGLAPQCLTDFVAHSLTQPTH